MHFIEHVCLYNFYALEFVKSDKRVSVWSWFMERILRRLTWDLTKKLGEFILNGFLCCNLVKEILKKNFGKNAFFIFWQIITFFLINIVFPHCFSIPIALLCGFLLGFGDACWNTQIFAFLIARYPRKSAEAFSLFKFFQSLLTCVQFYVSQSLHLEWHLLILTVTALLGVVAFYLADRRFSPDAGDAQITSSTAGRTLRSGDEGGIQHVD